MSISKPSPVVTKKDDRTVGQDFKSVAFVLFTLLAVASIEARLAYLQVIEGSHLHAKAESNPIRMLHKQPERGNIFDRNGKKTVQQRQVLVVQIILASVLMLPLINQKLLL
jgi:penicillin-binding protein 2